MKYTSTVPLSVVVVGGWSGILSTAVYCIKFSFLTRDQIMVPRSLITHSCRGNGSVAVSKGEEDCEDICTTDGEHPELCSSLISCDNIIPLSQF